MDYPNGFTLLESYVEKRPAEPIPPHDTLITKWATPTGELWCGALYHPQVDCFATIFADMFETVRSVVNAKG